MVIARTPVYTPQEPEARGRQRTALVLCIREILPKPGGMYDCWHKKKKLKNIIWTSW